LRELFHKRQYGAGSDAAEDTDWQCLEPRTDSKYDQQWNQRRHEACQLSTTSHGLVHECARWRLGRDETAEERADRVVQTARQQLLVAVHLVAALTTHAKSHPSSTGWHFVTVQRAPRANGSRATAVIAATDDASIDQSNQFPSP